MNSLKINLGVRQFAHALNRANLFAHFAAVRAYIGCAALMFAFAPAFARADNASDAAKDPAYQQMKRLVGGVWHTGIGGGKVESRWKIGPDGVTLVGETIIGAGTPNEYHMNARFGWDPKAKQVYYLDAHGLDTVYFGHGSIEGKDTVLTFHAIVGDPGEFVFRTNYTSDDAYHAVLYDGSGDKQGKVIESFDWTRTSS
jgi:hypothetical protein